MAKLKAELPHFLTYHSWKHTEYVLGVAVNIAQHEGIGPHDMHLLKTAALFHDIGFVKSHIEHEERGVKYCQKILPDWGYTDEQISLIAGMIRATKIPQQPHTLLECILADADLEYLGTNKFEQIGNLLYTELTHYNPQLTRAEWNEIQIKFMQAHKYRTNYCIKNCKPVKLAHLAELIAER